MNAHLRDRIVRRLDALPDERLYQILDYVEFLESKYAERQAPPANAFQKFAEGMEDKMRAGRMSASTIAETMGLMNKAMGVLSGVAAAGKSVANDIANVASAATTAATAAASAAGSSASQPAAPPATDAPPSGAPSGAAQNTSAPPPAASHSSSTGDPRT